jgi:sorbitol-specific phosphotransferase system component IIA
MTKHYNPNDYCFLCQSDEGFVLAQNTISDIITSVHNTDKVLGYTKDFNEICKLFTECIDIMVEGEYNIGDKISYNNCQYYVLEIGENREEGLQELIVGR